MRTNRPRRVWNIPSLTIALVSALCLAPVAQGQNRYLNLTWVDRSGEPIAAVGERGEYRGVTVSPDGARVAVHRHVGNGGEVWLFDADGEATRLVADATGVQDNAHPIFSPDGGRIVYVSLRDGVWGLYVIAADGRGDEELVYSLGRRIVPTSWSPDGRQIVYWDSNGTEWVLPLEGDGEPFRLMDGPSSHSQISPDGKWVAYMSSGDIWVRAFPDGTQAWQVSANRGVFPRWRADGRELYYMSDGFLGMMMAVGIEDAGEAVEVSEPRALFASGYVNLGHTGIYHTFAASPDGQRFLIPQPEPDSLVVVDGEEAATVARQFAPVGSSLSPDRTRVLAFGGDRRLWVTEVASGDRWTVGSVDDPQVFGVSTAWSPDGNRVAWLVVKPRGDTAHLAAANGDGQPETVATLPGVGGQLIGWAPDGGSLLYYSAQLGGNVVYRLPLDSDEGLIELARFDAQMNTPRISPDGSLIAYHTGDQNRDEVWVRSLEFSGDEAPAPVSVAQGLGMVSWREDGGELYYVSPDREVMAVAMRTAPALTIGTPRRLFDAPEFPPQQGNFNGVGNVSRDGRQAVFAVPPEVPPPARTELRVADRNGRVVDRPGDPGFYFGRPMLSDDGTKLAVGKRNIEENTAELWVFDLEAETSHLLLTDRNLGTWRWSPDGSEIAYVTFASNEAAVVYLIAADGTTGSPELLYRHLTGTGIGLADWSADGRFLLFDSGGVLFALPLEGDGEPVELIREEYSVGEAQLSPDGRWLAYSSNEMIPARAWLRTFDPDAVAPGPASEKWLLSDIPFGTPLSWGRSGREVTYRNEGQIRAVEIVPSPEPGIEPARVLFRQPEGAGAASASRNGERWVFFAPSVR